MLLLWSLTWLLICQSVANATTCDGTGHQLGSQAELDEMFSGCDIIGGDIFLSSNYSGPLTLPGVKTINGQLKSTARLLTSVSMPDLVNISDFKVKEAQDLTNLNLPLLAFAEFVSIQGNQPLNLSLPALLDIGFLQLFGNFSGIHLPLLQTVESRLTIRTGKKVDDIHTKNGLDVAISLPSLVNATAIELRGNITSLSLPSLTVVSDYIMIGCYVPVNISLPLLTNLTGYGAFIGNFEQLSLPSLLRVQGNLELLDNDKRDSAPWDISLPNLATLGGTLNATGPIKDLDIHSLTHVSGSIHLVSDLPLDCAPYSTIFQRINITAIDEHLVTRDASYTCSGRQSDGLSMRAKLGIGLGVGIPAFLLIGLATAGCVIYLRRISHQPKRDLHRVESRGSDSIKMGSLMSRSNEGENGGGVEDVSPRTRNSEGLEYVKSVET